MGRLKRKREEGGEEALSAWCSLQGFKRMNGSRPDTLQMPWPLAATWQGSLAPWGCRTSATWLLAGDLSSSMMAEWLGAELALGTGCSSWESDGSSFVFSLRDLLQVLIGSSRHAKSVFTILTYALFSLSLPLAVVNNVQALSMRQR